MDFVKKEQASFIPTTLDDPVCHSEKSPDGNHNFKYWKGRGDFNVYKCSYCGQLAGERL